AKSPLRFHKATINLVKGNYLFCKKDMPPVRYNNTKEEDIRKIKNKIFNEGESDYQLNLQKVINSWH
ncbi:MAG: hypothetical protein PHH93_02775, partial [Prolixibacteraceae bacterium]|nr:hypothetical protein [Prolixibacteraceae bacterium]